MYVLAKFNKYGHKLQSCRTSDGISIKPHYICNVIIDIFQVTNEDIINTSPACWQTACLISAPNTHYHDGKAVLTMDVY